MDLEYVLGQKILLDRLNYFEIQKLNHMSYTVPISKYSVLKVIFDAF